MSLFYTPDRAKVGDVIPFFDQRTARFRNFYLKNWNPDVPRDQVQFGWHLMSDTHADSIEDTPVGILGGTGSVVDVDGVYHLFYCVFENDPQRQWVRHAVSDDLMHWNDVGEPFGPDASFYEPTDWRDPFVFFNEDEGRWWMLVAARRAGGSDRNGCVGLCVSDDLMHWRCERPLYAPDVHMSAYECPDMFRIGEWWYLVFSNYTDGFATYYRMARSPRGPWLRPVIDTFDSRAFYAAKTGFDGTNRFIFGWNPTRGENGWDFDPSAEYGADYRTWNWGGSMVVHQLVQHADGTLGVAPAGDLPAVLHRADHEAIAVEPVPVQGDWHCDAGGNGGWTGSGDGFAAALGAGMPDAGYVAATLSYDGQPARFGLMLHADERLADGYYLSFDPLHSRIEWRSGLRMHERGGQLFPYAVEMERTFLMEPGKRYRVELFVDGSAAVMYVNRDAAFSMRLYDRRPGKFGWFVEHGTVHVSDVSMLGL